MSLAKPLRVLIVDDELPARKHLQRLLLPIADLEIAGFADNGKAAVSAIRQHNPDIVFLDIQMPVMNGLEVVKTIGPEHMPATIFVSADDRYALQAFDIAAVDYLLKPFDDERLAKAVQRARRMHELKQSEEIKQRIFTAMQPAATENTEQENSGISRRYLQHIAVESRSQVRLVLTSQIDYITASGAYAELHVDNKVHMVRERMQILEDQLDPQSFFRIHRSIIVQVSRIDLLLRQAGGDYTLKLTNGAQLPVSRSRIDQLEHWMGIQVRHDVIGT